MSHIKSRNKRRFVFKKMHIVEGEEDLPEHKRTGYSEYLMEQQEAQGEQAWEDQMLGEYNEDQD
jgi:hypothetical protein